MPRWRREHRCYSCHNNGDAVRALLAVSRGSRGADAALADSLDWLREPARWETNAGGEGGGDDRRLARIQFAAATADAVALARVPRGALTAAAALIASDQQPDGSWRFDSSESIGSPATWGTALATALARRALVQAGPNHRQGVARATAWLDAIAVANTPDAAAVLLAAGGDPRVSRATADRAVTFLLHTQGRDGGWGPYATSPPESFDTALGILALRALERKATTPAMHSAIERGRAYLRRAQLSDGSWPETTRPAGQVSYAQRISTTAWALLALLD